MTLDEMRAVARDLQTLLNDIGTLQTNLDSQMAESKTLRTVLATTKIQRDEAQAALAKSTASYESLQALFDANRAMLDKADFKATHLYIGDGVEYQFLGSALPAGVLKGVMQPLEVYRNADSQLYMRTAADFAARMEPVAPSAAGWVENTGTKPDLPAETWVDYQLRRSYTGRAPAGQLFWDLTGRLNDILKYRVAK